MRGSFGITKRTSLFYLLLLIWSHTSWAVFDDFVLRNVRQRQDCVNSEDFLYVCGEMTERQIFENLIQDIVKTKSGSETWEAIKSSGHNLMLVHEHEALDSAGKAVAELSFKLTNGIGSSVIVYFHTHIPDQGSHVVGGTIYEWTEFTKHQNFFHELSHARHKMNGTWDMMHSEEQAIRDENVYRHEVAPENPNLRSLDWDKGVQIWPHQKQDLLF